MSTLWSFSTNNSSYVCDGTMIGFRKDFLPELSHPTLSILHKLLAVDAEKKSLCLLQKRAHF